SSAFDDVRQGPRAEVAVYCVLQAHPEDARQAAVALGADSYVVEAAHRLHLALEGFDYLDHPHLRGGLRKPVAALLAPLAEDQTRRLELDEYPLEVLRGNSLRPGYLGARLAGRGDRRRGVRPGQMDEGAYAILGLRRHCKHRLSGIPIGLMGIYNPR